MKRDAVGLQVTLDVEGRRVVVVGGGAEAEDKVGRLLDGGAQVSVYAPTFFPSLVALAAVGRITLFPREPVPGDFEGAALVLYCERDPARAAELLQAGRARGASVWCCDDPEHSEMAMPALARLGRARVAISTAGAAPALAGRLRAALERDLAVPFAAFLARLGAERERLRAEEPDGAARREQLRALVDGFDVELRPTWPAWWTG